MAILYEWGWGGFGKVLLKAVLMKGSHQVPAISVELVDAIVF